MAPLDDSLVTRAARVARRALDGFLPEHLIDLTLAFHAENSEWTSRPSPQILRKLATRAAPRMTPGTITCAHARTAIAKSALPSISGGRESVLAPGTPSTEPNPFA
jgi:hypothetical protein